MTDTPDPNGTVKAVYLILSLPEATLVAETLRFGASFAAARPTPTDGTERADQRLTAIADLLDQLVAEAEREAAAESNGQHP